MSSSAVTSTSPPSCSNVNSLGGQQHQILPDPPKIFRTTSTLHVRSFSGNSAPGSGSSNNYSFHEGSGVKSPVRDMSSPPRQNETTVRPSVLGYYRSIQNQVFRKTGDMKCAVQKVLEVQERNSTGYRSNRRPLSMIVQSNSELNLNSENFQSNSGKRDSFVGSQTRVSSDNFASNLVEEQEDDHNENNNKNNNINSNINYNNDSETQIIKPIAKRPNSGKTPLTHSPSASEIIDHDVEPNPKPINTSSNVKTTKELLQRIKSSDSDPTSPAVRLRNPPSSRTHFRTRPQSLIESSSSGNISSIYRPNSVTSSYLKSPSIKPLKGSPLEDGGALQSHTPVNRVASNAKLLNKIQRHKLQSNPGPKAMSLDELQHSHKLCSRQVSTESVNSNASNSMVCTKRVIYDVISKKFYSPAEAYTQGLIDVNTFNRSRRDKTRLLFPKSRSVTSINSNEESAANEITGSNKIRKMCIHDRKSNEVLNLDEAFSRGIIDETRYNTLRNQEMDQSFSMGRKSASFNSLLFSSQQSNTLPRSGPPKVRPSSLIGDQASSSSQNLASSSTINPGTPTRKPLFRKISSPSSTLPKEDTGNAKCPLPFKSFVKHSRSQSANSLISTASTASNDSQPGKLFIKNPNSNALVDLKTAKCQELIDEKTYKNLREREERGIERVETLVLPSNIYVSVKTPQGKQKLELPEALKEGFISQDDYAKIVKRLSENGYGIKIENLEVT